MRSVAKFTFIISLFLLMSHSIFGGDRLTGARCRKNDDCFSNQCQKRTCRALVHNACSVQKDCMKGLVCKGGSCIIQMAEGRVLQGGLCSSNDSCYNGVCTKGFCKFEGRKRLWSRCRSYGDCYSGLCRDRFCRKRNYPLEHFCHRDYDCKSKYCKSNKCHQGKEAGVWCSRNLECKSRRCSKKRCKALLGEKCNSTRNCLGNNICRKGFNIKTGNYNSNKTCKKLYKSRIYFVNSHSGGFQGGSALKIAKHMNENMRKTLKEAGCIGIKMKIDVKIPSTQATRIRFKGSAKCPGFKHLFHGEQTFYPKWYRRIGADIGFVNKIQYQIDIRGIHPATGANSKVGTRYYRGDKNDPFQQYGF